MNFIYYESKFKIKKMGGGGRGQGGEEVLLYVISF